MSGLIDDISERKHREAFSDHGRWWIFRLIQWYAVPPYTRALEGRRFDTFEEARQHYISKVTP